MAKIHNPQDQDGILLINQTVFNGEVSARTEANTLLQSNIDNEIADRQAADNALQQNIEETETALQSIINAEKERAMVAESTLSTVIVDEASRAEEAEAALQSAINTEKDRAMAAELKLTNVLSDEITRASKAEELLTTNLAAEAARAAAKESELNQTISDEITRASEAEAAIESSLTTLNEKIDTHVETLEAADAEILTKITEERDARVSSDSLLTNSIEDTKDRVATLEGKAEYTTLTQQPSSTVRWTALEFKEEHGISNFINKRIKSIAFKVTNSVTTPHFLGVYDTRTAGSKKLIGISQGTTWNGDEAVFMFEEAIIIPGKFELFLLSRVISGDHTSDLPAPNVYLESYVTDGTQNYRIPAGTWASASKRSFYVTFNFVVDRLGTLETEVTSHKADTVQHITAEERSNWNSKPTTENVNTIISTALEDYSTTESINAKLEDYQLKSEAPAPSSDRYKFIPDDSSSSINISFADIKTNKYFSGGGSTTIPAVKGNIGEQTKKFEASFDTVGFTLKNPDGEIICTGSVLLMLGAEAYGTPSDVVIEYGEYDTLAKYGIYISSHYKEELETFVWTVEERDGYEGLRTGWTVSIGGIEKTISGGQASTTSNTRASVEIPQNVYKVDIIDGPDTETYTIGESFNGTLCEVSGNTLIATSEGSIGNSIYAIFYTKNDQPISKTLTLSLNTDNTQVITANATFNAKQLNPVVSENSVSIPITIGNADSSGYIILNTICDSASYDNAQYVCHVIPVRITL